MSKDKEIELIIHYGGAMRKQNDEYKYLSELGCESVIWKVSKIAKWESFVDFCLGVKVIAPVILIYFKDSLADMRTVNYVYEPEMTELLKLCYIGDVGGSIELFLEHECSETRPIFPVLCSSEHEDQDQAGGGDDLGYDDMANDERDDDEPKRETNNGRSDVEGNVVESDENDDEDDDDMGRPREDDEPEKSEDEAPVVDQNENQEANESEDVGDDVLVDEGDGRTDVRFNSLFKEGEQFQEGVTEDVEEKKKLAGEANDSDDDYKRWMRGDAEYPDTPVSSEEEWDTWMDKKRYKRKGKPKFHGELDKEPYLWLFQTFNSGLEFKDQLLRYSLNTQFDVKMAKSEKSRITCICCNKKCKWRVFCSVEKPLNKWMIKVCHMDHSHGKNSRVSMLKQGVIAGLFREELRRNVSLPAAEIKDCIKARYNIVVPLSKCYRGRRIALDGILQAQAIQFGLLWKYEKELRRTHPRITTELLTRDVEGNQMFDCFYICFEEFRQSWKNNCRPVIGLDECFLKWELTGDVLAAVGRDADNRMYPIAWAVVRGETKETWGWFLQKLKADLHLDVGEGLTVISDKQKGLVIAMEKELPNAEHRMCARHIYANWKKTFSRSEYKNLFWGVAYSYNKGEFKRKMKEVMDYDLAAYESLLLLEPEKWCRAYFEVESHCHDVHNNLSEAFNRTIKIARAKPVLSMLEDIRRHAMRRNTRRYLMAQKMNTLLTPITMSVLEKSRIGNKYCSTIRSSAFEYEVVEFSNGYSVRLDSRECTCRRWDLTGIPCEHAICVLDDNLEDSEQYVAGHYHASVMKGTYQVNIRPVNGPDLWDDVEKPPIGVPEFRKPRGRPKKRDRRKEPFEDLENAGKATRHGRIQHCGNCGQAGHIRRGCKNEKFVVEGPKNRPGRPRKWTGEPPIPKRPTIPRKKKQTTTGESNTQPDQPTEASDPFPASSSAPQPSSTNKKPVKKRKRDPPLKISDASDIPTISATLMSPYTSGAFDIFKGISATKPSFTKSPPKQP